MYSCCFSLKNHNQDVFANGPSSVAWICRQCAYQPDQKLTRLGSRHDLWLRTNFESQKMNCTKKWVLPKIGGKNPKWEGENNGKSLLKWMIWVYFPPIFRNINFWSQKLNQSYYSQILPFVWSYGFNIIANWAMKKPWLVGLCKGLYYPAIWGLFHKPI